MFVQGRRRRICPTVIASFLFNLQWLDIDVVVPDITVRLGKSGLRVSKIILGCMSYGSPEWEPWVLGEEEGLKHIKAA